MILSINRGVLFSNLLMIYLVSCAFTKLLYLPYLGYSFQLPEIVSIAIALSVIFFSGGKQRIRKIPFSFLDVALLVFFGSQLFAAAWQKDIITNKAILSISYLVGFYFLGKFSLSFFDFQKGWIQKSVLRLGWVLSISAVVSLLQILFIKNPSLELVEEKYFAGIGWLPRVEAFTMSPNMLFDMLLLPLTVLIVMYGFKKKALLMFILSAAILTFSKSLLFLPLLVVILVLAKPNLPKWSYKIAILTGLVTICTVTLFTKLLPLKKDQNDYSIVLSQSYATTNKIFEIGSFDVYESMHYLLNREAIQAFLDRPLLGIGPGEFIPYIQKQKELGLYPKDKLAYSPHSLFLGTLAQSGILGLSALLFFLFALYKSWCKIWNTVDGKEKKLALSLAVFLLLWLVDGLSMDTLHFRHFWWVVIVIAAWEYQLRIISPQRQRDTEVH